MKQKLFHILFGFLAEGRPLCRPHIFRTRRSWSLRFFRTLFLILLLAPALLPAAQDYKQALAEAQKAYDNGMESGNTAVRELIERHPGNIQLALEGLQLILGRSHEDEEWRRYASSSLLALEELGVLSWRYEVSLQVDNAQLGFDLKEGRRLSAGILLEKLEKRYPSWNMLEMFKKRFRDGMPSYRFESPATGSPMELLGENEMLDDRWVEIRGANPAAIAETIDKRIEKTIAEGGRSRWGGDVGYLEDWTVLDMHLRKQPAASLGALHAYQEKKLQEDPDNLTADALSVFRRFPWAETAHRRLFEYADSDLTRGRLHAAYRSFYDVRTHSANADLRKRAYMGCLLALNGLGETRPLKAMFKKLGANKKLPWMGKSVSVAELQRQLQLTPKPRVKAPDLASLKIQAVVPPPIFPWRFEHAGSHELRPEHPELQVEDDHVVLSGRRYLAAYDRSKTDMPKWMRTEEFDIGVYGERGQNPGSYSPALIDGKVYARHLGREKLSEHKSAQAAHVMNVIDLAGGTDLWAMGRHGSQKGGISTETAPALDDYQQFLSKPVLADGALLYLSFEHKTRNPRGYHSVVAVDVETRRVLWRSLIEFQSGEVPSPHPYGIPPIVHKGFVYAVSSYRTVSCHDLRDGRLVWVHQYKAMGTDSTLPRYAASPVVAGKRLICSPLDGTTATFALDLDTGRMIWSNPDVFAAEQIGRHGDTVLVRDELTVAALSVEDGKMRWFHRFEKPIIGWVQLMGDRLYVPTEREMALLSAGDGTLLGRRKWTLKDGPPQAALIDGDRLFVVGNIPYLDPAKKVLNRAAPKAPAFKLPLHLAWTLPVDYKSTLMPPPPGSPLAGKTYYLCGGVLTCAEANPQGGIVWQRFVRQRQRVSGQLFTFDKVEQHMFFGEVIVLRDREAFTAFNGRTGKRLWSRNINQVETVGSSGDIIWGSNRSGTVICLDPKTGKTLWRQKFRGPKHEGGVTVSIQGNVMHVLQQRAGKLWHFVLNPRTGQRLKTYEEIKLGDKYQRFAIYIGSQSAFISFGGRLFSYKMDGKPVTPLRDSRFVHVFASSDKYIVVEEPGSQLAVYKFGDAGYRATPLSGAKVHKHNWIFELDGERLICVERHRRMLLFNLQAQKILHDSEVRESQRKKSDVEKQMKFISRPNYYLRDGNRLFLQMMTHNVRVENQWVPAPAPSYFIDLQTGKATAATGDVIFHPGSRTPFLAANSILRYSNGLISYTANDRSPRNGIQCWSPKE